MMLSERLARPPARRLRWPAQVARPQRSSLTARRPIVSRPAAAVQATDAQAEATAAEATTAAAAAEVAAATAPEPAATEATAAATAGDGASTAASSSTSSRARTLSRPYPYGRRVASTMLWQPPIRVSGSSDKTRLAAYLVRLLQGNSAQPLLLTALGPDACLRALSAAAKLQDMLLEEESFAGKCVTVRATRRRPPPSTPQSATDAAAAPLGKDEAGSLDTAAAAAGSTGKLFGIFIALRPQQEFQLTKEQAAASKPMRVVTGRRDGDQQRTWDEQQRMQEHIVHNVAAGRPARLALQSPQVGLKAKILLDVLSSASVRLSRERAGCCFECTVTRELFDAPPQRKAAAGDSSEHQEQEQPAEAADGSRDGDAPAAEASPPQKNVRFLVTCYAIPVRGRKAAAAAAAGSGEVPRGAAPPRRGREGVIEVPVEEWNQLREQLEVVPHLTEQLQIMTRQHEQLLSLLAQQGQQGQQQQ